MNLLWNEDLHPATTENVGEESDIPCENEVEEHLETSESEQEGDETSDEEGPDKGGGRT